MQPDRIELAKRHIEFIKFNKLDDEVVKAIEYQIYGSHLITDYQIDYLTGLIKGVK